MIQDKRTFVLFGVGRLEISDVGIICSGDAHVRSVRTVLNRIIHIAESLGVGRNGSPGLGGDRDASFADRSCTPSCWSLKRAGTGNEVPHSIIG